jgi:hypothetical protein
MEPTQATIALNIIKQVIDRSIQRGVFEKMEDVVAAVNAYNTLSGAVTQLETPRANNLKPAEVVT